MVLKRIALPMTRLDLVAGFLTMRIARKVNATSTKRKKKDVQSAKKSIESILVRIAKGWA